MTGGHTLVSNLSSKGSTKKQYVMGWGREREKRMGGGEGRDGSKHTCQFRKKLPNAASRAALLNRAAPQPHAGLSICRLTNPD